MVKGALGKQFKKDAKRVTDLLTALTPQQLTEMETQLRDAGYVVSGRDFNRHTEGTSHDFTHIRP